MRARQAQNPAVPSLSGTGKIGGGPCAHSGRPRQAREERRAVGGPVASSRLTAVSRGDVDHPPCAQLRRAEPALLPRPQLPPAAGSVMPHAAVERRPGERDVRFLMAIRVDRSPRGLQAFRADPPRQLRERLVHVHRLRPAAVAGHHDARPALMPGADGGVAGVAVLAARPGTPGGLHVHAGIAAPERQRWGSLLITEDRDGRVGGRPGRAGRGERPPFTPARQRECREGRW